MTHHLTHLTMSTGHSARTPRSGVGDDTIMRLQALADAEGGPVAALGDGMAVDIVRPLNPRTHRPVPGGACATITHDGEAVAQCMVAWLPEAAPMVWEMAQACSAVCGLPTSPKARQPQQLPWLAVVICPGLALVPRETIAILADFERCLAWTLIETPL
jgi:hypothetical protein